MKNQFVADGFLRQLRKKMAALAESIQTTCRRKKSMLVIGQFQGFLWLAGYRQRLGWFTPGNNRPV
jgi:hypothetical protein